MGRWIAPIIGFVFLMGTISCKNNEEEEAKTATVTGYVYLSDTLPAPGVHVYDKVSPSYSGYTDKSGFFKMTIPAGARTIVIDGGIFKKEIPVSLSEGEIQEIYPSSSPFVLVDSTRYKIAILWGSFDAIQNILKEIGVREISSPDDSSSGYVIYNDYTTFPTTIEELRKFNLLAFNCGSEPPDISASVLREYVSSGGSIYASDWAYWVIDSLGLSGTEVFFHYQGGTTQVGSEGRVKAKILDDLLKMQLGKDSVVINFDHSHWAVIDSVKSSVKALLVGDVLTVNGDSVKSAPLSIITRMQDNGGSVFYTSFHYEAQETSEDMIEMLRMFLLRIGQN